MTYWQDTQDYRAKCGLIEPILRRNDVKSVLDIGCNAGNIAALLGDLGYFAVGIDMTAPNYAKNCKSAILGQRRLIKDDIQSLPKFDAIMLLSVLHQIIDTEGDEYARRCILSLRTKCETLVVELAGTNAKYGGTDGDLFGDNETDQIIDWFTSWLSPISLHCAFQTKTPHNRPNEPHRLLFVVF